MFRPNRTLSGDPLLPTSSRRKFNLRGGGIAAAPAALAKVFSGVFSEVAGQAQAAPGLRLRAGGLHQTGFPAILPRLY